MSCFCVVDTQRRELDESLPEYKRPDAVNETDKSGLGTFDLLCAQSSVVFKVSFKGSESLKESFIEVTK